MLYPNAHVELTLITTDGTIGAVKVRAPIRGEGLRKATLLRSEEPEIFDLLLLLSVAQARGGELPEMGAGALERLAEIGFFVSEAQASRSVRFGCNLDDPPSHLIPRRSWRPCAEPSQALVVNPAFLRLASAAPDRSTERQAGEPARFFEEAAWVRIEDPVRRAPNFYSVDARWDEALRSLVPGAVPPATLGPEQRRLLAESGILVAPDDLASRGAARSVEAAREQLRTDRYAVLRHALHPWNLAALRLYYRRLVEEGYLQYGDDEWPHRYFSYREPVTSLFHRELADMVGSLAGERVKPSFSYVASYRAGSELPPHRDREQCAYSVSLLLDYDPEPEDESPWPLILEKPGASDGMVPIRLGLGDCAIYRGCELLHYRERLADSHSATYWFLFYVPESFSGSLD